MKNIVNFRGLKYKRPDFDKVNETLNLYSNKVQSAEDFDELKEIIRKFEMLVSDVETNIAIAMIRAYLDSSDEYYNKEMQVCMQRRATIDYNNFYNSILNSSFTNEFDKEYGKQFLVKLKDTISIKASGMSLISKEQELIMKYQALKATIRVNFNGKALSEGEIDKYIRGEDREVRRKATIALNKAFLDKKEQFENILSELVKVRNEIAKVNGFKSFADYMNIEKGRHDYGEKELLEFCKNIKEEVIEFSSMLDKEQAKRLGLEKLASYDSQYKFKDGNATPVGDGEKLRQNAKKMYKDLGNDISELYNAMVDYDYIDVTSSANKISGMGFCTELFNSKFPYVFGKCTGSIQDVSVLTHEVGHAYQMYMSLNNQKLIGYSEMPNDVAEIPSKTMEHFTHDYASLFFGDDAEKFCFQHLEQSLSELTAYCSINEYESWLYSNPDKTPEERARRYYEGLVEISPEVDFSEVEEYMVKGSSLFRSMGIYMFPFYLISYALSAMSAMESAKRMSENREETWQDYRKLCSAGGSLSYEELLEVANLHSPFEKSTIKSSIGFVKDKVLKYIHTL